jgi:cytochrome c556
MSDLAFLGRAIAIAAALWLGLDARADDKWPDDKNVVEYREHIMVTLQEQAAAIGQILSGTIPDENSAAHFEAVALTAKTALKAFEPKVLGGQAKPNVWSDWVDFSKRMNDFAEKTRQTATIAKTQGNSAAMATIVDAFSCKSCHDIYRDEKKK